MAEFKRVVITRKGQALMAKLMSGSGTTHFTAIKVSDSSFNEDQLEGLTSIGNVKQTVSISKVDRTNNVAAEVEGAISNTNLTVGYYMRALGLYAQDPDEGEILYAVTIASQAGYMPPFNGKTTSGAFFRITTTIGNADNLNVQVNPSAVATIGEINDLQKQIDGLMTKANEIESGVINNTRTIRILSHDGKSLATAANATITARTEYIKTDSTLSDYGAVANAGAVGATIQQAFLILSASINQLVLNYNSLESNQTIVDIKNRLAFLEDQKNKENNK